MQPEATAAGTSISIKNISVKTLLVSLAVAGHKHFRRHSLPPPLCDPSSDKRRALSGRPFVYFRFDIDAPQATRKNGPLPRPSRPVTRPWSYCAAQKEYRRKSEHFCHPPSSERSIKPVLSRTVFEAAHGSGQAPRVRVGSGKKAHATNESSKTSSPDPVRPNQTLSPTLEIWRSF